MFEPGFRSIPLFYPNDANKLSKSDEFIDYFAEEDNCHENLRINNQSSDNEPLCYSLDNYEINLFQKNASKKAKQKKCKLKKKKSSLTYSSSFNLSTSTSYDSEPTAVSSDTSDDDSESYKAYKYRHAIGLNTNYSNNYYSQSSLSEINTNHTYCNRFADASSCDEYLRHSVKPRNLRLRLTTSFNAYESYSNEFKGHFLSQNRVDVMGYRKLEGFSNNLIF